MMNYLLKMGQVAMKVTHQNILLHLSKESPSLNKSKVAIMVAKTLSDLVATANLVVKLEQNP